MYNQAIQLDNNNPLAYHDKGVLLIIKYKIGLSLHFLKRYQEALDVFDQAIVKDPTNSDAYFYRGNSLCDLNRLEEAIHMFDKTIELDPKCVEAYNQKGEALRFLGRKIESNKVFKQSLSIDPQNKLARDRLNAK
ncbi:hypothetical protein pb186bvf_015979 [Paramecium bursaria]